MPRNRRKHRDSRPSWDHPFLPCIRNYTMADGQRKTEVDPDYESRYRQHRMDTDTTPSWRFDPTYDMRKPK